MVEKITAEIENEVPVHKIGLADFRKSVEGLNKAVGMLFERFIQDQGTAVKPYQIDHLKRNIRVMGLGDGSVRILRNISPQHGDDGYRHRFLVELLGEEKLDQDVRPTISSSATITAEELKLAVDKLAKKYGMDDSVAAAVNAAYNSQLA